MAKDTKNKKSKQEEEVPVVNGIGQGMGLLGGMLSSNIQNPESELPPLPSTAGTTATPINTTTGTGYNPATATLSQNIAHLAGVTPNTNIQSPAISGTQPTFSPTTSYKNSASFNQSESIPVIMNAEAMAKSETQQLEENKKADEYNATLTSRVENLNNNISLPKSTYDRYGRVIKSVYTPIAPLPVIPKEIEVPNMVVANYSKSYGESKSEGGGGGLNKPKIDTNIPLFFRDPNGQIRVGWDDYQSDKAEKLSGDPMQIKWNKIEDLRSIRKDWTAKQFENEGSGLQSGWKIKTLKGSNGKQLSIADASGNFYDIARASALSELAINRPDAVVTKDGKPLNQTSSTQFRLNPNNLFATATVTNEDGTKSKVQYLADRNAYPIIMDGISKALSDNGWKNGEIPKGKFWNNLKSSLKLAYKEPGGEARGGTSRDQFVRAIYSYIMSENQ